ncbi:MAG: hypothetical protein R3B91_19370 [Planctomycetaceae bacterium]
MSQAFERQTEALNDREQLLTQREEQLQQREQELENREVDSELVDDETDHDALDVERQEIDELRQSLIEAKSHIEEERASFEEQQKQLAADRAEVETAQEEIQRQIGVLESARDELLAERDRLEREIAEFQRQREQETIEDHDELISENRDSDSSASEETVDTPLSVESDAEQDELVSETEEPADEYEMAESADTTDDEDICEDEVCEDVIEHETEPVAEDAEAATLRAQLAELFGMGPSSEPKPTQAAVPSDHSEAQEDVEPEEVAQSVMPEPAVTPPQPPVQASSVSHEHEEHDSISAYMQQLLARNGQATPNKPEPPPVEKKKPSPSPTSLDLDQPRVPQKPLALEPSVETPQVFVAPPTNSPDRKNRCADTERANIDSLREVANLSARSALAIHNSTGLKNRFLIRGIVAVSLLTATVVLFTAHFWVGVSYSSWGFLAAAATCASAFEFLKTLSQLEANKVYQSFEPIEEKKDDAVLSIVGKLAGFAELLSFRRQTKSHDDELTSEEDGGEGEPVASEMSDEADTWADDDVPTNATESQDDVDFEDSYSIDAEALADELRETQRRSSETDYDFVPTSIDNLLGED